MKKAYVVSFAVVAVLLFTATNSYPIIIPCTSPSNPETYDCTADKQARGECFIASSGHIVAVVPDSNGNFPVYNKALDKTTFTYRIFLGTATKNLSIIDIKVGRPSGLYSQFDSSNPSGVWFTNLKGDPLANYFGAQDPDFDVFRWNLPACFYTGTISLTFKGNVVANSNQMLLKPVPWVIPYPVGNALGPLCEAAQVQDKITTTGKQYMQDPITGAGLMRCTFDQRSMLLECYDENGNPLNKYPVGSVQCTLENPITNEKHTITLDYASESCQLSGSGSDVGYWVFVRGNWICKCPLGSTSCTCPAR